MEMLRNYCGDRHRLGNAEQFLLQLLELPNYKIRCEGMLLKQEFPTNIAYLEPAIETIESAVYELKHCKELHEVLYMLLVAGNFLNSGGYAGDAAGFKMMSLLKIAEIRANKPGMNLIHYVAQEAESKSPNLLKFPNLLSNLEEASKLSIDNLKQEITTLTNRVTKMSQQVSTAGEDVNQQMQEFLHFATRETVILQKEIENVEKVRTDMADFLCEDLQSFKLEECFKIFHSFCQKFKAAIEENEKRRQQEKRAETRRKQREAQILLKKKLSGDTGSESDNIIDMLLGDIKSGFHRYVDNGKSGSGKANRTKAEFCRMNSLTSSVPSEEDAASPRIGSSSHSATKNADIDTQSPDITPNGTLRQKRNRLSSEDKEESLIDFLRQETPDCGSLDRSWIRRSSRRRRPDLIAAELNDRERPASPGPSPLLGRKTMTLDTETNKPKQWRLKIEEWLQENEKEHEKEKMLKEKIALERWKRQEIEQRDTDLSSTSIQASDESRNNSKNLPKFDDSKTDSELYANKSKQSNLNVKNKKNAELSDGMPLKDKSKWRKSTLNVANSSESIDDERRRSRSRKQKSDPECEDTISFYMRSPERQEVDQYIRNGNKEPNLQFGEEQSNVFSNATMNSNLHNISHETPNTEKKVNEIILCSETKQVSTLKEPYKEHKKEAEPEINIPKSISAEISVGRSRFYQSMREPSYNKIQSMDKISILDDQALVTSSQLISPEKHFIDKSKSGGESNSNFEDLKTNSEIDEESNFDRFSFMRKTRRRTRNRLQIADNTKNAEDPEKTNQNDLIKHNDKLQFPSNNFDKNISDINIDSKQEVHLTKESPILNENQNSNREKNKVTGSIFTKNITESTKNADNSEDSKRKEKHCTSLKARLSKRLLSFTENLKSSKSTEPSDTNTSTSPPIKSVLEEKFNLMKDPSSTRIDEVLQERRASLKEEKFNPPIMEHREKVLSRSKQDIIQLPQRKFSDEYNPIMAEPKLLKENFFPDLNDIKIAHSTPVTHTAKLIESYTPHNKGKDETDKDEGFEETQSQVSEAASQGAGSNYDTDLADSPRSVRQTKNKNTEITLVNNITNTDDLKCIPKADSKEILSQLSKTTKKTNSSSVVSKSNPKQPQNFSILQESKPQQFTNKTIISNVPQRSLRKTVLKPQNSETGQNEIKQKGSKLISVTAMKNTSTPVVSPTQNIRQRISENKTGNIIAKKLKTDKNKSPQIARKTAEYTKAIKSMTNNLSGSKRYENYDVTQSMPPTPSEESKTFISTLNKSDTQKTRSTSSMYNPGLESRRLSEKSLGISLHSSKKGSDKSLSRKSSDRSLNLSRKSSETSVITVKSINRKSPALTKKVNLRNKPIQPKLNIYPRQTPVASKSITRAVSNANTSVVSKPSTTVRRVSSDKVCGFMKATSASSAKLSSSRLPPDQKVPRSLPRMNLTTMN